MKPSLQVTHKGVPMAILNDDIFKNPAENRPPTRNEVIHSVVALEWSLFQEVNNTGGRADCQNMPETFFVMRGSQFDNWTDEMIVSYGNDLFSAEQEGRNLLSEKYAYMMRSTHPDEWEEIKHMVPEVTPEKSELVEKIVAIQLGWADELAERYPNFMSKGRAIRTEQDTPTDTSLETYSRGELSTYSVQTLQLMLAQFEKLRDEGTNLQEKTVADEAKAYGYESLEAAEKAIAEERMSQQGLDPDGTPFFIGCSRCGND